MHKYIAILAVAMMIFSTSAASESKDGAAVPYAKLETLTVNLHGLTQYLQVNISLKLADPKISESIKGWTPAIRHEIILLLSSRKGEELATLDGKKKIMAMIKDSINKILKLEESDGVTDVLFEAFVIQ